jgi:hypothetical protein
MLALSWTPAGAVGEPGERTFFLQAREGEAPLEAEALDAYSRAVSGVAERLSPSVANLRVSKRTRRGRVPAVARHAVDRDALAAELRPADAAVLADAAAGIVMDDVVLRGASNNIGEIGNILVDPGAEDLGVGQPGTLAAACLPRAFVVRAARRGLITNAVPLDDFVAVDEVFTTLCERAYAGETACLQLIDEAATALAARRWTRVTSSSARCAAESSRPAARSARPRRGWHRRELFPACARVCGGSSSGRSA